MSEKESDSSGGDAPEADAGAASMAVGLFETLRPHQWVKNLFVLAPIFFAQRYDEPGRLGLAVAAAGLFCLAAGSVYLINDLFDVDEDRKHPVKKHRPIPSGRLPVPVARVAAGVIALGAVGVAAMIDPMLAVVIGGYIAMNLAYSTLLKHLAFIDVTVIAVGFVLRVLAGKYAIDVYVSEWLIGCTFLLALYLGLGKRVHELRLYAADDEKKSRRVLERYHAGLLEFAFLFVAGLTIAVYTIYTLTAALPELTNAMTMQPLHQRPTPFATPYLPVTVLFAVFGITRFFQLAEADVPQSPTDLITRDIPFIANLVLWGAVMLAFGWM